MGRDDHIQIDEELLRAGEQFDTREEAGNGNWSSGTFSCHRNVASCSLSCCCPCVQYGFNQRIASHESCVKWAAIWMVPMVLLFIVFQTLDSPSVSADQLMLQADDAADAAAAKAARHASHAGADRDSAKAPPLLTPHKQLLLVFLLLGMAATGVVGAIGRSRIRKRYNISGGMLNDFLCHCCCHCCSLAREAREVRTQAIQEVLAISDVDDL